MSALATAGYWFPKTCSGTELFNNTCRRKHAENSEAIIAGIAVGYRHDKTFYIHLSETTEKNAKIIASYADGYFRITTREFTIDIQPGSTLEQIYEKVSRLVLPSLTKLTLNQCGYKFDRFAHIPAVSRWYSEGISPEISPRMNIESWGLNQIRVCIHRSPTTYVKLTGDHYKAAIAPLMARYETKEAVLRNLEIVSDKPTFSDAELAATADAIRSEAIALQDVPESAEWYSQDGEQLSEQEKDREKLLRG